MNKVYYVTIKGRTLESRNLKELLTRAVAEKRNQTRKSLVHAGFDAHASRNNAYAQAAAI
jgi:hypothetical protein